MMKLLIAVAVSFSMVAACTTTNEIIIDQKGVNMSGYQQDVQDKIKIAA